MKLALVAMSGVRAADDELMRAGLTMPGVMERSRVIASLPSLSLLTLAALTPNDIDIEYHEVRDLQQWDQFLPDCDLVAISSYSAQIPDAYELADRFMERGTPVVLGGLHVTAMPEEAMQHATSIAVGEGEALWPRIIHDFRSGRLKRVYRQQPNETFDLRKAPIPRFDLLDPDRYNRLTVQTSRGCPYRCEFCAGSILLTPGYAVKPVDKIIAEIRRIKSIWAKPFIEFADDNSFVNRRHARQLLEALRAERIQWFTEVDISIARDPVLLTLMRESGCRQVLIGLESPTSRGLDGVETRGNWKLKQLDCYEQAVRTIQQHGITVNGCFILGLDGDDEGVFDRVYDFIDRTNLYDAQLTVLTPFPGTPLYERLRNEGRILDDGNWRKCTLFDVNFAPRHMSPAQLRNGLLNLAERVYDPAFIRDRRKRFFEDLRPSDLIHHTSHYEECNDAGEMDQTAVYRGRAV